jgi:SAM-dependent methyltransferase
MGITNSCAKFLFYSKSLGVNFEETLMVGRQQLYTTDEEVIKYSNQFNFPLNSINLGKSGSYAEPFFKLLGAKAIESIDFTNYEDATIIHDLNNPIPDSLKNKFTLLFDGGTLEHVFNFPVAIKNCMDALKPGGHFISITPSNNLCGHGFYQFSPELFFSLFSHRNGFEIKKIFLGVENSTNKVKDWYQVINPKELKKRVTLTNDSPTFMLVLAEKISSMPLEKLIVQQSDYENVWNVFTATQAGSEEEKSKSIKSLYKRVVPKFLRDIVYRITHYSIRPEKKISGLGFASSDSFKKVDL